MALDPRTIELLSILHRGGEHAYWWALEGRQSFWWTAGKPTALPGGRRNVYFGIHPTTEIPQTTIRGEKKEPRELRAQLPIIAALNCLYTEYDAKDFDGSKEAAYAAVEALDPPPSVVVDSGGGYHCYWLFDEPFSLTTPETREEAKRLQAAWVAFTGGDPAVKDLARVLRVPGTLNYKYDPPRPVTFVFTHFERRYARIELATLCAHLVPDDRLPDATYSGSTTQEPANREQRYARAALDREVAAVLRAPAGLKHDTIRNAAVKLGSMAANGWLTETEIVDEITRAANIHRSDVADTYRTALDGVAYGRAHPRDRLPPLPERAARNGTATYAAEYRVENNLPILLRATELHRIPQAIALIRDVLFVNTLHQFFGAPGSAKSFILLDIACTVAQTYRVIYVAAEAIEDYEARVNAWSAHYSMPVENLFFWREPLRLGDSADVERFITAIQVIGPALIVLDPLADCMTGLDENTASDMGIAIGAMNTIRRVTHAAIAIVHHTGWNDERERGHSVLRGACRIVVKIEMRDDGQIRFSCVKKNQGVKFTPRLFRLVAAGEMGGVLPLPAHLVLTGRTKPTERMLRVMEALTTEPLRKGATHTQLMQDTNIAAGTLNRVLTVLTESGFIRSWEKGRAVYYELTDDGTDALAIAISEGSTAGQPVVEDTMEESGRHFNWFVLSSTVTGLQEAVLPKLDNLSSTSTAPTPHTSPFRGLGGVERQGEESSSKVLPAGEDTAVEGELFSEPSAIAISEMPPAAAQEAPRGGLDWTYLRGRYAAGDDAAIVRHCTINRADVEMVREQLRGTP